MSLSSKEAAETLSDVERATRRSAEAFGYEKASPHLILWGVIWLVGYAASDLFLPWANWIWLGLIVFGCVAATLIGRNAAHDAAHKTWRIFAMVGVAFVFIASTYAVMAPTSSAQFAAFPPVLVGSIYAGIGVWFGLRYVVAGLLIIALTLGGYFYLHEHFLLWMAAVGGGGLILAGIWFRQV